jgi:hypothetical protein
MDHAALELYPVNNGRGRTYGNSGRIGQGRCGTPEAQEESHMNDFDLKIAFGFLMLNLLLELLWFIPLLPYMQK